MEASVRPRSLCDAKWHPAKTKNFPDSNQSEETKTEKLNNGNSIRENNHKCRTSWPSTTTATTGLGNAAVYVGALGLSDRSPSMAGLLKTTVPQRLAPGPSRRYRTPTRQSLRHSRMIGLLQQGQVPWKYLPRVIRRHKLGICLSLIQIIVGLSLIAIVAFLLWSPTTSTTPSVIHWSPVAAPLLLSGFYGSLLLSCCRKSYPGLQSEPSKFIAKNGHIILSVILALMAAIFCLTAAVFTGVNAVHLFHESQGPDPSDTSNWTLLVLIFSVLTAMACLVSAGFVLLVCVEHRRMFRRTRISSSTETKAAIV